MTQVLSLAPRHMVHPRMDLDELSRGNSSEPAFGALHPSSSSPIAESIMRRPPVSINAQNPSHDALEQLRINTASAMKPEGARDMICLCTPTPKIPRPRNAFILYRQHHQSQVTADNPRLSNPDISKIIGERWKNEQSEVKDTWKKLAEEEKERHQHQYPNYRYQPRRGAKSQNWSGSSPGDDQGRCSKCHGRFIATPRTPSAPFVPPVTSRLSSLEPQPRPSLHRLDTDIPRRASMELSPINKLPVPGRPPSLRSPDDYDPTSPDVKRRRANGAGDYHLVSGRPDLFGGLAPGEPMRLASEGGPTIQTKPYASVSLPELGGLPRSNSFPMPPPPRPPASWPWGEQGNHARRDSGFDESLRLPPLQTRISPSPSRTVMGDDRHISTSVKESGSPIQRGTLARGVLELEVMSISFKRKLGVLARICRPAPPLSREGPCTGVRGALIAVEGPSTSMVREVGMAVERGLVRYGEISLRAWTNDCVDGTAPMAMTDPASGSEDRFSSCFQTVLTWQEKSKQILRHITGCEESRPGAQRGVEAEQGLAQSREANKGKSPDDEQSPAAVAAKMPVALVKEGFSLTLSDRFACTTPIADMYAPVDHWQWMASLWRGIVCPDLVIYVKPSEQDEISTLGTVDFSRHMGLIVVRVGLGKGLDEATERRLAFEVMEWMREGSFREAVPQNWRLE